MRPACAVSVLEYLHFGVTYQKIKLPERRRGDRHGQCVFHDVALMHMPAGPADLFCYCSRPPSVVLRLIVHQVPANAPGRYLRRTDMRRTSRDAP
jgi:hypothetical protein